MWEYPPSLPQNEYCRVLFLFNLTLTGAYCLLSAGGCFIYILHNLYIYWGRNGPFVWAIHNALQLKALIMPCWLPRVLLVTKKDLQYVKYKTKNYMGHFQRAKKVVSDSAGLSGKYPFFLEKFKFHIDCNQSC